VPAGRVSNAIFATVDFLPTFANLAGFQVPDDRPIDGIDQTDLLLGKTDNGRETFLYGNNGIRAGKWKYLKAKHSVPRYAADNDREEVEELYDLADDIGETTNLAAKHPDKVEQLESVMNEIIKAGK
jgi:arylsulfatase A-like enzyme